MKIEELIAEITQDGHHAVEVRQVIKGPRWEHMGGRIAFSGRRAVAERG